MELGERASTAAAAAGHIRTPASGQESRDDLRDRQREMREVQRELDAANWKPIEVKQTPWHERLKSGDRVYVRGISQPVEVITPPDLSASAAQAQRVEVLLGTMRAKIPVYQLQSLAEGHPTAARQGVYLERAETRASLERELLFGIKLADGPAQPFFFVVHPFKVSYARRLPTPAGLAIIAG